MQAARWLAVSLTLALAVAEGDSIMPGVSVLPARPKRQGIVFPGDPIFDLPRRPVNGPGRFAPAPQPPANPNPVDGPLDLPEDMDLNALDLSSLTRVNSIGNITDFASLFGIELPLPEDTGTDFELVTRIGGAGETAELATMATCKPEVRTVELDLPTEANTLFYPTCVRLEQCGGCCYGPLLTCRPKVTKVVKYKVLKTVVGGSNSPTATRRNDNRRGRRRRRETVPSYHEVEAIKHVQCECGCKVQEQDCNPAIHNYQESDCACVCKSKDEKVKCEQQGGTKYWDIDSCACYCRRTMDCSTGEFFSHTTCGCERLAARGGFPVVAGEGDFQRRRPFERPQRRRPVRIPLHSGRPVSSRSQDLHNMLTFSQRDPSF